MVLFATLTFSVFLGRYRVVTCVVPELDLGQGQLEQVSEFRGQRKGACSPIWLG